MDNTITPKEKLAMVFNLLCAHAEAGHVTCSADVTTANNTVEEAIERCNCKLDGEDQG